jgi:hypothetical protein
MIVKLKIVLLIALLAALFIPGPALAGHMFDDRVVFGGNFTLESGETLDGDLAILGGNATLESGSTVTGSVVVMGGNLRADGTIEWNIVGLGGLISLGETAVVEGDVTVFGGQLDKAEGARVEGNIVNDGRSPFTFTLPGGVHIPNFEVGGPVQDVVGFFIKVLIFFLKVVGWAALAVLVVLFLPEHTRRVSQAAIRQPLIAGGLGLLTLPVLAISLVALTITLILIPVSAVLAALAVLAWAFGLISLGLEVGHRLAGLFKLEWAPPAAAGAGTFLLMLVVNGFGEIACVGWVIPLLVGVVGLGAVLLTRFGMQDYLTPTAGMPLMPAPPSPPEQPLPPEPPASPEG